MKFQCIIFELFLQVKGVYMGGVEVRYLPIGLFKFIKYYVLI